MKVRVFKNLNKGCLSIIALEGKYKSKVIAYAHNAYVHQASFVVSQASRARVLSSGVKNVHAFVQGELQCLDLIETRYDVDPLPQGEPDHPHRRHVRYNPFIRGEFFDAVTHQAVANAACAFITNKGVFLEEDETQLEIETLAA